MLNAGRNPGLKLWALPKSVGFKPILRLITPLQFLFSAKNRIGYPLVPATYRLTARRRFEYHLPDCDKSKKP